MQAGCWDFADGFLKVFRFAEGLRQRVQADATGVTAVAAAGVENVTMKKLLELLVCLIHPVAVILMWVNLAGRSDLTGVEKVVWAIFGLIPLVPFLYVLVGGNLW